MRIDTPGGLVEATREIVQAILAAPLPIVAYVAPSGGRATSAGTFIVYAAHVAAMAPGTHLGAATPINLGGVPDPLRPAAPRSPSEDEQRRTTPEVSSSAIERKVLNDTIAFLRGVAQLRGRNADWAERAVRDAATLTAEEALRESVIDLMTADIADLLKRIDGRTVAFPGGPVTIDVAGSNVEPVEPTWRIRFLETIANPNIAFILLMLGAYGILFELYTPGFGVGGVIGAISLLLGMTALIMLPVNIAGLALLLLGCALLLGEALTPGVGVLGVGGVVAIVVGAIFLFDPEGADVPIAVAGPVIAGAATLSATVVAILAVFALRSRTRRVATGSEGLIGMTARVVEWRARAGTVWVHGEAWRAQSKTPLLADTAVRVVRRDGLVLEVEPS
ncbi:MAG: nodulation protein NfeD [Alphaproteobacteria bacterium]|nr:nodulation protein NfeD [Alphaproteobacteria bacterium]